jgi:hypothetical protein
VRSTLATSPMPAAMTANTQQPVFLLDTMSFIFRAYHAMQRSRPMSTRSRPAHRGHLRLRQHDHQEAAQGLRRTTSPRLRRQRSRLPRRQSARTGDGTFSASGAAKSRPSSKPPTRATKPSAKPCPKTSPASSPTSAAPSKPAHPHPRSRSASKPTTSSAPSPARPRRSRATKSSSSPATRT